MHESPALASPRDHPVWQRLSCYQIGPADAAFTFSARLARENGWPLNHAERVIEEYRRFCFLAVTSGQEVTPSDAVDQAWHLHLTYTRDYWEHFCPEVLGSPLHHAPAKGGAQERGRFFEQYAQTLKAYQQVFGSPPADIWLAARRRLLDDPKARRVHPRDALILPWRRIIPALIALGAALAAIILWWRL